jgi:hypothetical protein
MPRFTIRELLLLTVIAALAVGWALERFHRSRLERRLEIVQYEEQQARFVIDSLYQDLEQIEQALPPHGLSLVWSREMRPTVQQVPPTKP